MLPESMREARRLQQLRETHKAQAALQPRHTTVAVAAAEVGHGKGPLTHSHSLTHSLTLSLTHSHSLTLTHSLTLSLSRFTPHSNPHIREMWVGVRVGVRE